MLTNAANRDSHHRSCFAQREVFVENQMQSFSLSRRQACESMLKPGLSFESLESIVWLVRASKAVIRSRCARGTCQLSQQSFAMLTRGCLANHCKQPRLEACFTAITRFTFNDLQIDRLQNFFGFRS